MAMCTGPQTFSIDSILAYLRALAWPEQKRIISTLIFEHLKSEGEIYRFFTREEIEELEERILERCFEEGR